MSTVSGSSSSLAASEDGSSVSNEVVEMLSVLEGMDEILISQVQEGRLFLAQVLQQTDGFPVTHDDLALLADAKKRYQDANYNTEQVRVYLLQLPVLDKTWAKVCRGILRYHWNTREQVGEWRQWLSQMDQAGDLAWQQAFEAIVPLLKTYQKEVVAMKDALIRKLAVVDNMLDEIHRALHEGEREVRFSAELRDTFDATIAVMKQGGEVTLETVMNFRAAIRANRAAAEAQFTGNHQEPGAEDNQPRRRINAVNPQPADENQDGLEGQAGSTTSGKPDAPHQYNPTVLTVIIVLIIAAACLTGFAWTKADHSVGSYDDADFWLLLQSSILQLAGMAPVVLSLWLSKGVSLQPRLWSWILVVSGALCSVLAPALYVAVPKEFSGVVAYVGGVAQAFIVLEAMFLADRAVKQNGAKEKAG